MVKSNEAQCKKCKEILKSITKEQIKCKCGSLTIGGGLSGELYRKGEFIELSKIETEEKPKYWPW